VKISSENTVSGATQSDARSIGSSSPTALLTTMIRFLSYLIAALQHFRISRQFHLCVYVNPTSTYEEI